MILKAAEQACGQVAGIITGFESAMIFSGMLGPPPRRGLGIVDTLMGLLMVLVWPLLNRFYFEKPCKFTAACRLVGVEGTGIVRENEELLRELKTTMPQKRRLARVGQHQWVQGVHGQCARRRAGIEEPRGGTRPTLEIGKRMFSFLLRPRDYLGASAPVPLAHFGTGSPVTIEMRTC
ncbi:hypothetical protein B0T16DRAFT_395424 [Cercophora newfieldiana]|uniref:Uncharacterized protein n=1 Tax=Cercophora newfieldiana TaxID=92897 RepID=A0AA40CIK2_9PEZI|nr:hypothetical protein B0T16DRAFT_395424 [Cercophora newfieldiana]